jgi:hypothetical protein
MFLFLFTAFIGYWNFYAPGYFVLHDAIEKNKIDAIIQPLGGHVDSCVQLKMKNFSDRTITIKIPLGMMLVPLDSNVQSLVVMEDFLVALAPKGELVKTLRAYCTEEKKQSPEKKKELDFHEAKVYGIHNICSGALMEVVRLLHENKNYFSDRQMAIWVASGTKGLGGIRNMNLKKQLSKITGKKIHGYQIKYLYQPSNGQSVESMYKPNLIEGVFPFFINQEIKTDFGFYDAEGKLLASFYKNKVFTAGEHRFGFNFKLLKPIKAGKYYVRLTSEGRTIGEMDVDL